MEFHVLSHLERGHAVAYLIEALCNKPEGRGSDSGEVIGSLNWSNPSNRTMTLGSAQPLTRMSTRNFPGGQKGCRRVSLITSPPSVSWLSRNCVNLNISQHYGPPWPVTGIASLLFSIFSYIDSVSNQVPSQTWSPRLTDQGCDNVLRGQGWAMNECVSILGRETEGTAPAKSPAPEDLSHVWRIWGSSVASCCLSTRNNWQELLSK
jgi:hypothetical protein